LKVERLLRSDTKKFNELRTLFLTLSNVEQQIKIVSEKGSGMIRGRVFKPLMEIEV